MKQEIPEIMIKQTKLMIAKQNLADTDYKLLKYLEGYITEEEYEPIKAEREELREIVRKCEKELEEAENE